MEKALKFTDREMDIINGLVKGSSNEKIGNELFLSGHTVKSHLENIYQKINVHNRVQLVVYLFKNGIIT